MLKLLLRTCISGLRSRQQLAFENLALQHQIEVLQRTAGRPRLRTADRALWVLLSRICRNWRRDLVVFQPDTIVRWHRLGWRLYWRRKSRPRRVGRPIAESQVRALIRRLPQQNPLWGAPRIHNHLAEIVAIDFLTVPTVGFRTLYVFVVLSLDRRRIVHLNVTESPTAEWASLQLIQAFPFESAPRFLIRGRDRIYGDQVVETIRVLGIEHKAIAYESPWLNGYVERVIGSIRRECLDQVIVFGERHLRLVLREYVAYCHGSRTHLGLDKDAPEPRAVQSRGEGVVVSDLVLNGLHHRYWREAA